MLLPPAAGSMLGHYSRVRRYSPVRRYTSVPP
jgi:hypothetical protein